MSKEVLAREALAQIPKLLTLLDRNPHSPTYGCFDRNYWHYRMIDFPSGMAQEFVLPLALAYKLNIPGNPYFQNPATKCFVEAGISFAARSTRRDGSCDDYFPYERAGGAAAFSLLACVESYTLLGLNNQSMLTFFKRRAGWLAEHHEAGRLSNHQALIALCLALLSRLFNSSKWDKAARERLERVLAWQSDEGWFQEYEGCDPGYHTLTLSCLARIYEMKADERLKQAIGRAVAVSLEFIHPDGSFGGEYGSRNTYNFFPHGFELAGKWMAEALAVNDLFLRGLARGLGPCYLDDHIIGHHTWNYLLAWRDYVEVRPVGMKRAGGRLFLRQAGILIERRGDTQLYAGLNKGGVFKLFKGERLAASDTHISLQVQTAAKIKNAVGHLIDEYEIELSSDEIQVKGTLGWAKQNRMTTGKLIVLRLVMITVGRFFPNPIRRLLQKMLITGKRDAPFRFARTFKWANEGLKVIDEVSAKSWANVISAGVGCDQTSIYVVMSRTFQAGQLQEWLDLTDRVKQLADDEPLNLERSF